MIVVWENGKKVRRHPVPADGDVFDPDAEAERVAVSFIDESPEILALGAVIADLVVAAGFAADTQEARQEVRRRFKAYYIAIMRQRRGL